MGAYWLHDLPEVVGDAGLDVQLWPGWEARSRGSGGYDQVWAVFCHHTASQTSKQNDCSYMWDSSSGDQPIGAIYLDRSGLVVIGAAGATNCQGAGGPLVTSHGTIPVDKGNAYGIAIEAANNGIGEAWPVAQTDAYTLLVAALADAYDLDAQRDCASHFEWTTRKIDPAGPSPWATGANSWNMNGFRAAVCGTWKEDDDVTQDDIDRIAKAVWQYKLVDEVPAAKTPSPAGDHLRLARRDSHGAAVGVNEHNANMELSSTVADD